jgi:tripartite-type tricarboxylate transporter receptor subunit TctC
MISRSTLQRLGVGITVLVAICLAFTAPLKAADFSGKRITAIVPFSPGGGSDTLVRFLAPYLRKYLPGNPAIIVRNVPGAGSIRGANMIEKVKRDGRTFLCASASTMMNYIMQDKRIKFKPKTWIPFLNVPTGCVIYARKDLGLTGDAIEDIKTLQKKQVVFGGNSPTSGELPRLLSMYLLGLDVKPVFGLNRGPVRLGFERGEFTINYDTMAAYLQIASDLIQSGTASPLFSFGVWDPKQKQLVRDPSVPDIPHFVEVFEGVYGKKPTGAGWKVLLNTMNAVVMNNKVLVLPEGTPKDLLETWHTAAAKVVKDQKFVKEAPKKFGVYNLNLRDDAKENLMNGIAMDDDARAWLYNFLEKNYSVKLDR